MPVTWVPHEDFLNEGILASFLLSCLSHLDVKVVREAFWWVGSRTWGKMVDVSHACIGRQRAWVLLPLLPGPCKGDVQNECVGPSLPAPSFCDWTGVAAPWSRKCRSVSAVRNLSFGAASNGLWDLCFLSAPIQEFSAGERGREVNALSF